MEKLDGGGDGEGHDGLLVVVEEEAGHDVACHLTKQNIPIMAQLYTL